MIFDGKPARGSVLEAETLAEFSRLCSEINWNKAFCALGEETLLVIDPEVQAVLEADYGAFQCHVAAPTGKLLAQIPEGVRRILFLCREQEWPQVKAMRQAHPTKVALSLIYDVAPMGLLETGVFPEKIPALAPPEDEQWLVPVPNLLLTSPGADSEYLQLVLQRNKVMGMSQLVGRALAPWLLLSDSFHLVRFAVRAFAHARSRRGAVVLDMYLLYLLVKQTPLSFAMLVEWASRHKAHLLYFISRDKARQVAVNTLLVSERFSSLWVRAEKTIRQLDGKGFDQAAAIAHLWELLELEEAIEKPLQNINSFKIMTLEDLVVSPDAVVAAIAQFWGCNAPRRIHELDWYARYRCLPNFLSQLADMRAALTNTLGLDKV